MVNVYFLRDPEELVSGIRLLLLVQTGIGEIWQGKNFRNSGNLHMCLLSLSLLLFFDKISGGFLI